MTQPRLKGTNLLFYDLCDSLIEYGRHLVEDDPSWWPDGFGAARSLEEGEVLGGYPQQWANSEAEIVLRDLVLEHIREVAANGEEVCPSEAIEKNIETVIEWRMSITGSGSRLGKYDLWYPFLGGHYNDQKTIRTASREASRPSIERIVERYLSSPLRSSMFERKMIKVLFGIEYVDYVDTAYSQLNFEQSYMHANFCVLD